ncbi:NPC intracellular cholesterol transporter 1 homolog 1b-like [Penaeus monodon]|uniref:NPC intracellular cholesterol transporter 1 homolog 1b-like n=1 Tax=Penaeus monodon TaxID=6687 RepID=UPI0018A728F0|nr:NPC intracellular cholesterol transporter 1 homolog 1b-like [Penaeus monodon]
MSGSMNKVTPERNSEETQKIGILGKISGVIIGLLEHAFYCYGKAISRAPFVFIFLCLLFTGFCAIGLTKFTTEERPFKLWTPTNSDFLKITDWKEENFPSDLRLNMAIFEADNVLEKRVILEMLRVHDVVVGTSVGDVSWERVCAKVPTLTAALFGRRKRDVGDEAYPGLQEESRFVRQTDDYEEEELDWSLILSRDGYCDFQANMEQSCLENSLLEVFGYDRRDIESLSQEQIIDDINYADVSAVFGFPLNATKFLGGIERDADGLIVKARTAMHLWFTKVNRTAIELGEYLNDGGSGSQVDLMNFNWEQEFIKNVLNETDRPGNISFYLGASSSFGTISSSNIEGDLQFLSVGFGIVFIYVVVMLGKFNLVEQRPVLSLLGLSCVGLAVGVSYGLCSAFGVPYGPVNSILPFLLLGLGIDDMFVIMQAWNNLTPQEQTKDLHERIGSALRHAGVSITVTSVTDFVAFAIGSTTVLPALRSFCLYAAIGIAAIYFFQSTYFVAWLSLDQRRLEDSRHGFLWCWKIKNWTPNECSQRDLCQTFFTEVYAKYLFKLPVKIIVIVVTAAVVAVSGWGLSNLRQEFDPIWFLPQDSYLYNFFVKQKYYYPSSGEEGTVYFGNISLLAEMPKIEELVKQLNENEYVAEVDSWYPAYKKYWEKQGISVPDPEQTEDGFLDQLSQFLHSPSGSPYRSRNFRFSSELICYEKAPPVTASSMNYKHKLLKSSQEKSKAMEDVKAIVRNANFTGYVRPWSRAYAGWETDQVIEEELYRNMGLALLVVFVVTLLLIASLPTSLMVLVCVFLTLIDVGALMHWWGLTIDTVSCIDLVLAIGLCVDYAAHVGHTFMTHTGTRDERARATVGRIGPAVLNGGFSTFLSFVFLSNSSSHVFLTFFKVFFAVCLYGLYHGLVFLPVLLSLVGPAPYPTAHALTSQPTPVFTPTEKRGAIPNHEFIEKTLDTENQPEVSLKQDLEKESVQMNGTSDSKQANLDDQLEKY